MPNPNLIDGSSKHTGLVRALLSNRLDVLLNVVTFTRTYISTQATIVTNATTSITNALRCESPEQTTITTTTFAVSYEVNQ